MFFFYGGNSGDEAELTGVKKNIYHDPTQASTDQHQAGSYNESGKPE